MTEMPAVVSGAVLPRSQFAETGQRALWKQLMPPGPAGVEYVGPILPTPGEKSYVYGCRRMLSDLYVVDGLK